MFSIKFHRDLVVELPFTLTHPKPKLNSNGNRSIESIQNDENRNDQQTNNLTIDHNLIQLDTKFDKNLNKKRIILQLFIFFCLTKSFDHPVHDDDFIFEEFARIRLKGHESGPDDTDI